MSTFANMGIQMEKNKREKKFNPVRWREFAATMQGMPLTPKFYAKHDQYDGTPVNEEILEWIVKHYVEGPREKNEKAMTTNQEYEVRKESKRCVVVQGKKEKYGWFLDPIVEMDRCDRRWYQPQLGCDITFVGTLILMQDKMVPPTKFQGTPFKV